MRAKGYVLVLPSRNEEARDLGTAEAGYCYGCGPAVSLACTPSKLLRWATDAPTQGSRSRSSTSLPRWAKSRSNPQPRNLRHAAGEASPHVTNETQLLGRLAIRVGTCRKQGVTGDRWRRRHFRPAHIASGGMNWSGRQVARLDAASAQPREPSTAGRPTDRRHTRRWRSRSSHRGSRSI